MQLLILALLVHSQTVVIYRTKTILIVEDNVDLCELLSMIIRGLGHEVTIATTGEQAVERASAVKPDLILMDIGLPKLNGAEATVRIKRQIETEHIPVVILTAARNCLDAKRALESGAAEVLQKPVSVPKIQEIVSKYLPIGQEASSQIKTSDEFSQQQKRID